MKCMTILGVIAMLLPGAMSQADELKKDESAEAPRLTGTYAIVRGEKGGNNLPANRLKDVTVRIAENAITTYDRDKKEVYVATYEIDASRKPWKITMTATLAPGGGKGAKASGLIEKNGDDVKLIYALPGGATPTEFKTEENQQMFVLKKTDK